MNFQKLTLGDIDLVKGYYTKHTNKTCDRTIGGTFMWRDYFATEYAVYKNTLIMKCRFEDENMFCFPVGENTREALTKIEEYCLEHKEAMRFVSVDKAEADYLAFHYPDAVVAQEEDWSDYLYLCTDHANFPGKKFHTQKNHVNKFQKTYENWSFEPITKENLPDVIAFYHQYEENNQKENETALEEKKKTEEVLQLFDVYKMEAYVLYADGKIAGFTMGEIMKDVLFVHIEKVDKSFVGASAMIVQQFARTYQDKVIYLNREEDVGDEGLRYSKMQYRPIELLCKYEVEVPIHGPITAAEKKAVRRGY